jgi:hypothetical protein
MSVAQSMTSPPQSLASFRSVWSRRPQNSMSIEYLIRSTAFAPEAVNAVLAAYGRLRKALTLADGDDCANWSVATKIVEQVWLEERDPDWMCRQVLKELGSAGSWSFSRIGLSTNHCASAGREVSDEKVARSVYTPPSINPRVAASGQALIAGQGLFEAHSPRVELSAPTVACCRLEEKRL